ncbi:MAG: hypothetical protein FJX63_00810 [Alphaproteobacteria bacterium]|nr:hypothetical protein [Alphaproteobacteria bacterium]
MRTRTALTLLLLLGTAHTPAWAAATTEEAARLTSSFQAYFSDTPGVVTVSPEGEEYLVKIDFAPLLAKVSGDGFSATIAPFQFHIADMGEGKWKYREEQPYALSLTVPGSIEANFTVGKARSEGTYDAQNMAFTGFNAEFTGVALNEVITDFSGQMNVNYGIDSWKMDYSAAVTGDGIVDGKYTSTMSGLREDFTMPMTPGAPPAPIHLTASSWTQDGTFTGLRSRALTELLAWFVAHPSEEAIKASQAELKALIAGALPFWASMTATSKIDSIMTNTPVGPISIGTLVVDAGVSGASKDGKLREKFALSGITPPPGIVPPWAEGLVPHTFSIDFTFTDIDLETPTRLALDNLDLNREPSMPPEIQQQLLAGLLPKGTATLSLAPSEIVSKLASLSYEGSISFGPASMPTGKATICMKGLDEVIAALNSAPPEMGVGQMMPMVLVAKGLAKTESDGSYSWVIESTDGITVTVNGVDPTKMQ